MPDYTGAMPPVTLVNRRDLERLHERLAAAEQERDALRARVAELEAKAAIADSVPWDDLSVLLMGTRGIDGLYDFRKVVVDWVNANRPQETPHAAQE